MEREPNEPNSNSTRTIFRTYLILIGIDLLIAHFLFLANSNSYPQNNKIQFGMSLTLVALGQLFIILPATLTLPILSKWEIKTGIALAELTILFLGFLLCTV